MVTHPVNEPAQGLFHAVVIGSYVYGKGVSPGSRINLDTGQEHDTITGTRPWTSRGLAATKSCANRIFAPTGPWKSRSGRPAKAHDPATDQHVPRVCIPIGTGTRSRTLPATGSFGRFCSMILGIVCKKATDSPTCINVPFFRSAHDRSIRGKGRDPFTTQ